MNDYKSIETKVWNAVSVLTSGVLTSLIYEAISSSSYVLEINGKQYVFTSIGKSIWGAVGFILAIFLLLWTVIYVIIPLLLRIRKRFTYDKIRRVNAKDLVKTLDMAKELVKELYPVFCAEGDDTPDPYLIKLHNRDLTKTILLLHGKFLPHNKKMRKAIENYFRNPNHSSIITIDRKISSYEFDSVIALLRKMVSGVKLNGCGDKLLKKDCAEMEKALNDLDELSEGIR